MHDFVCPIDRLPLTPTGDHAALRSAAGRLYPIHDGIPDFVEDATQDARPAGNQDFYRTRASEYDRGNDVMFKMLLAEQQPVRESLIDALGVRAGMRVLEIGCGTCRDTVHLLRRNLTVYAGDLAPEMLAIGRQRLVDAGADVNQVHLFRGDVMRLPFPDGFFDAAFHFGGLNLFPDIAAALAEMARVVKPGGRVVAGDEGVGSWLAQTQFAKILKNSNPLFEHTAPLDRIPLNARDVTCRWILSGSFYLISFEVGDGEPELDLDVEFPGWRGGSHRTRYFGRLEGVSPELRHTVVQRAAAEGLSITAWLERALRKATEQN
ncbi:methyltransferase domain-containing protein [Bradyrhizobium jicamae]|uniref:methyltransferase domain-containing protein n=1 Tax=Bradyrhizobium jicamae TaxID=280332 RepID=UPI001BA7335F|nr:methyltransferase domain-containing protein [Bradyrhizobium jicamae]